MCPEKSCQINQPGATSPDKHWTLSSTGEDDAQLHDISNKVVAVFSHDGSQVNQVSFSPDSRFAATSSIDGFVRIWEVVSQKPIALLRTDPCQDHGQFSMALSPGADFVATGCSEQTLRLWKVHKTEYLHQFELGKNCNGSTYGAGCGIYSVAFSPDGRSLAASTEAEGTDSKSAAGNPSARIWAWPTGHQLKTISGVFQRAMAYTPDGQYLLVAVEGKLQAWKTESFTEVETTAPNAENHGIEQIQVSPDGHWVATLQGRDVLLWRFEQGRMRPANPLEAYGFAFEPGSNKALAGVRSAHEWITVDKLHRLDLSTSKILKESPLPEDQAYALKVSKTGRYVVALATKGIPSDRSNLCILDSQSLHNRGCISLERHVYDFAISPDEKYIATAGEDGNARIFSIESKTQIGQMSHGINVWAVDFSPKDGQFLATGSEDGTVRVWRWRPDDLISETCQRLPRNLVEQEWRDFIPTEPPTDTCPPEKMLAPLPAEAPPQADEASP